MVGLDYYLHAWNHLTTCRDLSTLSPIPWTAVHMWATREGMNRDGEDDLWYYTSQMDVVYLKVVSERRKDVNAG